MDHLIMPRNTLSYIFQGCFLTCTSPNFVYLFTFVFTNGNVKVLSFGRQFPVPGLRLGLESESFFLELEHILILIILILIYFYFKHWICTSTRAVLRNLFSFTSHLTTLQNFAAHLDHYCKKCTFNEHNCCTFDLIFDRAIHRSPSTSFKHGSFIFFDQ